MNPPSLSLASQGTPNALVRATLASCGSQQQQQFGAPAAAAAALYRAASPAIAAIPHWAAPMAAPPFPVTRTSIPPPIPYRALPRPGYSAGVLHSQGQLALQASWSPSCVPVLPMSSLSSHYRSYQQAAALQQLTSHAYSSASSQAYLSCRLEAASEGAASTVDNKSRDSHRSSRDRSRERRRSRSRERRRRSSSGSRRRDARHRSRDERRRRGSHRSQSPSPQGHRRRKRSRPGSSCSSRTSSRSHSSRRTERSSDKKDSHREERPKRSEEDGKRRRDGRRPSRDVTKEAQENGVDQSDDELSSNPEPEAEAEEGEEEDYLLEPARWIRSSPAELYYQRDEKVSGLVTGTAKLHALQDRFRQELVERSAAVKSQQEPYNPPPRKSRLCNPNSHRIANPGTSDSSSSESESDEDNAMEELEVKRKHPYRLHQELWYNDPGEVKGMIVVNPGMKPCALRVDQLDRELCNAQGTVFPEIVHFGIRPPQLSYAGNPMYQKAWRDYVKFRHLLANKPKVLYTDRHKLLQKEAKLQEMRLKSNLKRDVTVVVSSQGFFRTGIMCDVVQHALLLPVLVCHLRFHKSLDFLESIIGTEFKDRYLLQLALTHPSYRENFGTNPDHARNSLTNCGIRQPEYGDRRIHYLNTRKRGINTLINIMSRFGRQEETASSISHNERLEFLGDAVVEFLSSIHLFFMFPDLEEGGLATYRAAIVQNQHLAVLAKKLELEKYMLYAHGSDLCHDLELRHAMANCFEALMGALFLDSGIKVADRVFSTTLFSEPDLLDVWVNYPPHPLQEQVPEGDRKWIDSVPLLKKLNEFENLTGIEFTHIRLLAKAFTHRSIGFNNLTLGSNQRLEFLGDTVLQLVASEYLYKYFPEHHEGHLSLLRSSLVNNRTQAVVCDDLGMVEYTIYPYPKAELKTKDRADILEAFLGALFVDKGLEYCNAFCQVCFFPRLQDFILNQDWNDPKSKLQQCCLTLRSMDGGEPDIPVYKVIECKGPTNTRVYTVAVYFRRKRLATGSGHSIQQAEMAAASKALEASKELFPQLSHQRRVLERSLKQRAPGKEDERSPTASKRAREDSSRQGRHSSSSSRSHGSSDRRKAGGERRKRSRSREVSSGRSRGPKQSH
ncbi:ribonuclease 3-like isoform X3 [Haemaphysalis longicornis]